MEKFCPACSRVYGEDAVSCELDGERLVLLSEEPSLVGHVLDSKYTLISKLGEGGMGSVYLAEQATMGREVAIKVLRREFSQNRQAIKRFLREARAASKLAHPNTITVYDFGQSNDGLLYLVMERLSGRPLADILDSEGALPVDRAVHIVSQICDSLAEAHRQGITHRDLKPENIFIEQKVGNPFFVKVLDFGIAKMAGDEATTQATATGMICGTPSYMSPEQAMGKEIDGRSDIYALGILLYEMLTNEKPFEGDTPMEVMLKHINEPSPNVYQRTQIQIPQGLQDALDKMLSKKAEQRPKTCEESKALIVAGMQTPLVGPITSVNDPTLPKKRRDETNERLATAEKTGLQPAIAVPPLLQDLPIAEKRKGGRTWIYAVATVLVVGGGIAAFALTRSNNSGAAEPEVVATTPPPGAKPEVPVKPEAKPEPQTGPAVAKPEPSPGKVVVPEKQGVEPVAVRSGLAAGAVVGIAGDRALGFVEKTAQVVPPPVEPPPVEPAQPAKVSFKLDTTPTGAEVYEGEVFVGKTPLAFDRKKDSGSVTLKFVLKGYQPAVVPFGTIANIERKVELKRAGGGTTKPGTGGQQPGSLGGTF